MQRRDMSGELKPGDRVRVTVRNRMAGYQPGDKGRILGGPHVPLGGHPYYLVAMETSMTGRPVVFMEEEIEPDV
jgi:hypothetical protein